MDRYIQKASTKNSNKLNERKRFYLIVENDIMMDNKQMLDHIQLNKRGSKLKTYSGGEDHKHFLAYTDDAELVLKDIVSFILGK